ncbi:hypothetical protein KFK09_004641 [Dendrobium nobile]|uniref:Uncharacterized protein n=1 Tax=Dendrobium nobile TaxID=94219 RepID=A0A8T3C6T4_DENNO|nr:hypothetical protein KFK09_004641 [Dendrobium nobile]
MTRRGGLPLPARRFDLLETRLSFSAFFSPALSLAHTRHPAPSLSSSRSPSDLQDRTPPPSDPKATWTGSLSDRNSSRSRSPCPSSVPTPSGLISSSCKVSIPLIFSSFGIIFIFFFFFFPFLVLLLLPTSFLLHLPSFSTHVCMDFMTIYDGERMIFFFCLLYKVFFENIAYQLCDGMSLVKWKQEQSSLSLVVERCRGVISMSPYFLSFVLLHIKCLMNYPQGKAMSICLHEGF